MTKINIETDAVSRMMDNYARAKLTDAPVGRDRALDELARLREVLGAITAPMLAARDARVRLEVQHALDTADAAIAGQKAAEAERDAALAQVARMRALLSEAADILDADVSEISDLENTLSSYRENWRGASIMSERIRAALKGASHE